MIKGIFPAHDKYTMRSHLQKNIYYAIIYLQANTKSALWLGDTYLYSAKALQETSRKVFLLTIAVVRLLYKSKGLLFRSVSVFETR